MVATAENKVDLPDCGGPTSATRIIFLTFMSGRNTSPATDYAGNHTDPPALGQPPLGRMRAFCKVPYEDV